MLHSCFIIFIDESNVDSELEKSTLPRQQPLSSHKKKKMEVERDSEEHGVDKTESNLTKSKDMVDETNDMEHDMSNDNLETSDSATTCAVNLKSEVAVLHSLLAAPLVICPAKFSISSLPLASVSKVLIT